MEALLNGLTEEEVEKSKEENGTNTINSKENTSFLKKFIESLGDPIIRILLMKRHMLKLLLQLLII